MNGAATKPRRFLLAAAGTHGDVFPFIGLAVALRDAGHEVTLATNASYQDEVEALGVGFAELVSQSEIDDLLRHPDIWHPVRCALVGARWTRRTLRKQYRILADLATDDSILVACPAFFAPRLVQETKQLPLASIYYTPWMIISSHSPPAMTSGYTLPRGMPSWIADAYWWSVDVVAWTLMGGELNRLRREIGLAPIRRVFRWCLSPDLAIGLFPDWFAPPPPDWPRQMRVADFPRYQGGMRDDEQQAIAFSKSGEPPVVFTFGTGMRYAADLMRAAVEACQRLGARGILLSRDAEQLPPELPENIGAFDYARLDALLPHCRSLVHHGGIGTGAAGLYAGVPQVIIPHAWDQLDNANHIERLGAGVALRRRRATAAGLAGAIENAESVMSGNQQCYAGRAGAHSVEDVVHWLSQIERAHD